MKEHHQKLVCLLMCFGGCFLFLVLKSVLMGNKGENWICFIIHKILNSQNSTYSFTFQCSKVGLRLQVPRTLHYQTKFSRSTTYEFTKEEFNKHDQLQCKMGTFSLFFFFFQGQKIPTLNSNQSMGNRIEIETEPCILIFNITIFFLLLFDI